MYPVRLPDGNLPNRRRRPARSLAVGLGLLIGAPLGAQESPQVTVGGVVYGQFAWLLSDTAGNGNNFDITRAYINVVGQFPHGIGTRVTPDIYRVADGSLSYRLKYAFVSWNPGQSPFTLKLGMLNTPYLEWEENLWDYRMQGTVALDRNGYLTSSDFGFLVDGSWGSERVAFSAGVINGENYNRAPGDRRKDLAGRVTVRLAATDDPGRTGGLRITGYAHYGKPSGGGARERYVGVVSYRSRLLTLAGVAAVTRDSNPSLELRRGRVLSGFGVLRIPDTRVQLIARVDRVDPDTRTEDDATTRWIGGVAYQLAPNLRVLADLARGGLA